MGKIPDKVLKTIHDLCGDNKWLKDLNLVCWCFYCKKGFNGQQIKDFAVRTGIFHKVEDAICPYCGIDSVIPSFGENNRILLLEMYQKWFSIKGKINEDFKTE